MEFRDVVRRRRMVRNFENRLVAEDVLDRVLSAGRRAPSAGNAQATEFVVLVGRDETARYWDVTFPTERRDGFRYQGLFAAPVLILPVAAASGYLERYSEPDKVASGLGEGEDAWPVPYWHIDAGMAAMNVLLAAVDEGLGALFFGIFAHEAALMAELGIPSDRQPIGTIALGHPAPDEPGRSASRGRRPATDVIHRGRW